MFLIIRPSPILHFGPFCHFCPIPMMNCSVHFRWSRLPNSKVCFFASWIKQVCVFFFFLKTSPAFTKKTRQMPVWGLGFRVQGRGGKCERERERARERERKKESFLVPSLLGSGFLVSFKLWCVASSLSRWISVDMALRAGDRSAPTCTPVGVHVGGQSCGPSSRRRRRKMTLKLSRSSQWMRSRTPTSYCRSSMSLCLSLNQVTKHVEIPQTQYINKVIAVLIMKKRQVPQLQTVAKTVEAAKMQFIGKIVDVPVIMQRQVPQIQTVMKTVECPEDAVHRQNCGRPCDHAATWSLSFKLLRRQ